MAQLDVESKERRENRMPPTTRFCLGWHPQYVVTFPDQQQNGHCVWFPWRSFFV